MGLSVAGLFAGIGGVELGLSRSGHQAEFFCEVWAPAQQVLSSRFAEVPLHDDITTLKRLPKVDLVAAGFPCTDLSQAGRTAGIFGKQSGLVGDVFRLLDGRSRPQWLLVENVRNLLALASGEGMNYIASELEARGYSWAYRLVDSRFTGTPQRRQRVILLASRTEDPRLVLHADDSGERSDYRDDAFGFYWTEGLRGLGWAQDAVPTLKGGSTIGIPSAPAIWVPANELGHRIVTPAIRDAEALQGFPRGWTDSVTGPRTTGNRWKLVGNAVTVGVSQWVGERLAHPGESVAGYTPLEPGSKWPLAAYGNRYGRWAAQLSMFPRLDPYEHLLEKVDLTTAQPVSRRGAAGFYERLCRSSLRVDERFRSDIRSHLDVAA